MKVNGISLGNSLSLAVRSTFILTGSALFWRGKVTENRSKMLQKTVLVTETPFWIAETACFLELECSESASSVDGCTNTSDQMAEVTEILAAQLTEYFREELLQRSRWSKKTGN